MAATTGPGFLFTLALRDCRTCRRTTVAFRPGELKSTGFQTIFPALLDNADPRISQLWSWAGHSGCVVVKQAIGESHRQFPPILYQTGSRTRRDMHEIMSLFVPCALFSVRAQRHATLLLVPMTSGQQAKNPDGVPIPARLPQLSCGHLWRRPRPLLGRFPSRLPAGPPFFFSH